MRQIALVQLGIGQVGGALARMVRAQRQQIEQKLGLRLTYTAIADIYGLAWAENGLDEEQLDEIVQVKGRGIADLPFGQPIGDLTGFWKPVRSGFAEFDDGILVDVTAADGMETFLEAALRLGWGAVLSNKKPLVVPLPSYQRLMDTAGRRLRYEATVGAGLPVMATLRTLLDTGDEVQRIEGCFSGTLGYLCHCLQEEMSFSAGVREAKALGYTEPDPREDLGGMDVARKALILARMLGHELELADVEVEALFPAEMAGLSVEEFMATLERLDGEYEQRVAAARGRGRVLRYVAEVEGGCCKVGWREVGQENLMAALRGPDNIVRFTTKRYKDNPLVIVGPGAGPQVTAGGVLGDILAIALGGGLTQKNTDWIAPFRANPC